MQIKYQKVCSVQSLNHHCVSSVQFSTDIYCPTKRNSFSSKGASEQKDKKRKHNQNKLKRRLKTLKVLQQQEKKNKNNKMLGCVSNVLKWRAFITKENFQILWKRVSLSRGEDVEFLKDRMVWIWYDGLRFSFCSFFPNLQSIKVRPGTLEPLKTVWVSDLLWLSECNWFLKPWIL